MLLLMLPGILFALWGLSNLFDLGDDFDDSDNDEPQDDFESNTVGNDDDDVIVIDLTAPQEGDGAELDAGTHYLTASGDTFNGSYGSDTIYAGDGDDLVGGEPSTSVNFTDSFEGEISDDDTIYLGAGNDILGGSNDLEFGDDEVYGGEGDDVLSHDGFGQVTFYGDSGDDVLVAMGIDHDSSPDTLYGGDGNDILGGDGRDELSGGDGEDKFLISEVDWYVGGPVTILDYEEGEVIEVSYHYTDDDGPRTVVPTLSEDGTSLEIDIFGTGDTDIILEGVTDISEIEIIIISAYDEPDPYYGVD